MSVHERACVLIAESATATRCARVCGMWYVVTLGTSGGSGSNGLLRTQQPLGARWSRPRHTRVNGGGLELLLLRGPQRIGAL